MANKETASSFYASNVKIIQKPPQYDVDVLRLAINFDHEMKFYIPELQLDSQALQNPTQLVKFNQKESLASIIQTLCSKEIWNLRQPDMFALQLTTKDSKPSFYVTEKNRETTLKNGEVLLFTLSPANVCQILLQRLKSFDGEKSLEDTLEKLAAISCDSTVAEELTAQGGLPEIISLVESGQLANMSKSCAYLLTTFWQSMEQTGSSWDDVSEKLIHEVALFVVGAAKIAHPKATSVALAIVESIATSSSKFAIVEKEVPMDNLVILLFSSDHQVQHNALALMNTLFTRTDGVNKEKMALLLRSTAVRDPIMTNVLRNKTTVGAELAHQLHVLQRHLLNMYDRRSRLTLSHNSVDGEKLLELRRLAFEATGEAFSPPSQRRNPSAHAREYKKLGFAHTQHPSQEFDTVPPGVLALDCALYFAEKHKQNFTKIIVENSCRTDHRECPFMQSSIHLVCTLLDVCRIGEPPVEEGQTYYEVFFSHEMMFEELFSLCIVLLNRTWKEMKASGIEDMSKVLSVVKEQVTRSLQKRHQSFKELEAETKNFTYSEILKIWDQEQTEKETNEFMTPPIMQLKEYLRPQILELVKTNRYVALKEGQEFAKYSRGPKGCREKGKFWYWRLSPNEKSLIYSDCHEQEIPKVEDMKGLIDLDDIEEIRVGSECPHIKELMKLKSKSATGSEFAFSILLQNRQLDECFNFVVADSNTFYTWLDGLHASLGKEMTSQSAKQETEMFLNLEIKLRMLDVDDIRMMTEPLPPPPCLDELFA